MDTPKVFHWLNDKEVRPVSGNYFNKYNPATGQVLTRVAQGNEDDVKKAVAVAIKAFEKWSRTPVIKRADIIREAVMIISENKKKFAKAISVGSGKPEKEALGEIGAAIECGYFMAGEGRRYHGLTLESAVDNRSVNLIRESIGPGALIVPFNNPLASIAWKAFPALLCGNSVILKSHEYTPYVPILFAQALKEAGLPAGVFSVLQGFGKEVGLPLVRNKNIKFISFTGSAKTGSIIIKESADRLAKVSIEAGGKNPFVVADDADLERAATLATASAFVDGGQRCAATSRIIIFNSVYDKFKKLFLKKVESLKIGISEDSDYGAIINEQRLKDILKDVDVAVKRGASCLTDERKFKGKGYFLGPVVLENIPADDEISQKELFGPVVILYKAKDLDEAIALANNSQYKLSGAIHTVSISQAYEFNKRFKAGVCRINGPTFGSEPHMPFGGPGLSGNGWREPGEKALDFYSEWKQVSIDY